MDNALDARSRKTSQDSVAADPGTVAHEIGRLVDAVGALEVAVLKTENLIQRPPQDGPMMKTSGPASIPAMQRSGLSSRVADLADLVARLSARLDYVNDAL
jgi:hypothetical protein